MSPQSKHFINTSESVVVDSLRGLCAVNPELALDSDHKIVYIPSSSNRSKVSLICGGGSGHEPAHAGFVGSGILAAAVCGNIFASPSPSQVLRGIDLAHSEKGTVIIVKNYTGDVLNFGLAKEQYAALHPDQADLVKFVIVGDDVAVGREQGSIVGRRGLAGTVLVYKIAGALAERGASLHEVEDIAQWVASNVGTIGVGLEHCHIPGTQISSGHLSDAELEIGMGIHNESGHRRVSPIPPLAELIPQILELITSTNDPDRSFLPFKGKDNVVLMINNLGGLSELELGAIVGEARKALETKGITIARILSGSFMTSLNMPGFSLTLLLLPSKGDDRAPSTDLLLSLLNDKTAAPGWKWSSSSPTTSIKSAPPITESVFTAASSNRELKVSDSSAFIKSIDGACKALITAEPEITRFDTIAGDGDCGLTLKAGAQAILQKIAEGTITGSNPIGALIAISQVAASDTMGGTSGALYSIFFSALAQALQSQSGSQLSPQVWTEGLTTALEKLYTYTRARPPSRTLIDPLAVFITTLSEKGSFKNAITVAAKAAESTKNYEAKAGRSAYVDSSHLKDQQVPDPGAWGVKIILENL